MQIFLSILLSLTLSCGCSHLAKQRGRNPLNWFIAGLVFGIFALIVLFFLPIQRRREEASHSQTIPPQKNPKLAVLTPSYEEKLWYFLDEQKSQIGPMSFNALSKAWAEGKIGENTYVWNELMENWQQLQDVIKPIQS
jgi:hypothetical protein